MRHEYHISLGKKKERDLAFSLEYFESRHDSWNRVLIFFFFQKIEGVLLLFCNKFQLELIQYFSRNVGGNP